MSDVIDDFIRRYRKEFDFYQEVSRLVEEQCASDLEAAGIRAIVTYRAKRPDSLLRKLRQRAEHTPYSSVEEVYADIHDLAGVRIALYFPADRENVGKILRQRFVLLSEPKEFPDQAVRPAYHKRFSGYWATHYRLRLNDSTVPETQKRYADAKVEVQVASVLMHAWAEVEHDLVYKPAAGALSADEYAALDEINGLVLTGEIALERLQRALERRVERGGAAFSNHYELAAYLYDTAKPLLESAAEPVIGRVDVLFQLLRRTHLATPDSLQPFIQTLETDTERRPVAEQIIDQIIAADPTKYEIYAAIQRELRPEQIFAVSAALPEEEWDAAIGAFMTSWIKFERVARELGEVYQPNARHVPTIRIVTMLPFLDREAKLHLERIRRVRNALVHGMEVPEPPELRALAAELDELMGRLANDPTPEVRGAVRRGLETLLPQPTLFGPWRDAG